MIIELSLKEADDVLEFLGRDYEKFHKTMSTLKNAIKLETETQIEEIDRLMDRIEGSNYGHELKSKLASSKEGIKQQSLKARGKWFDEEGNEKRKR